MNNERTLARNDERTSVRRASWEKADLGEVGIVAESGARREKIVRAVSALDFEVKCWTTIHSCREGCALVILDCVDELERSLSICSTARRVVGKAGVLAITMERSSLGRAKLLEAGADLVLAEPYVTRELYACVRAITRRGTPDRQAYARGMRRLDVSVDRPANDPTLVGGIAVDQVARAQRLTETERLLLEALCVERRPVATAQLLDSVFRDAHYLPHSSHLRVHLHRLRKKLVGAGLTVKALYGRGYRLVEIESAPRSVRRSE